MKSILRPIAKHAARNPIETIVCTFALSTLAYFHVLSAIKHSTFLTPTFPSTLRPAHALLREGAWVSVGEEVWFSRGGRTALELQQVVFSTRDASSSQVDVHSVSEVSGRVCRAFFPGRSIVLSCFSPFLFTATAGCQLDLTTGSHTLPLAFSPFMCTFLPTTWY